MHVRDEVLDSVTNLLSDGMESMPVEAEIMWKKLNDKLNDHDARAIEAILDAISWSDMYALAQMVAARLPEPAGGER